MRKAVISEATGLVVNVILLDGEGWNPPAGHTLVDAPAHVGPGAMYDAVSGTFAMPAPPAEQMSRAEFIRRLGPTRLAAILAAAQESADVLYFVELARNAPYIDPAEAVPALEQVEAAGVLPAGTATEIFS